MALAIKVFNVTELYGTGQGPVATPIYTLPTGAIGAAHVANYYVSFAVTASLSSTPTGAIMLGGDLHNFVSAYRYLRADASCIQTTGFRATATANSASLLIPGDNQLPQLSVGQPAQSYSGQNFGFAVNGINEGCFRYGTASVISSGMPANMTRSGYSGGDGSIGYYACSTDRSLANTPLHGWFSYKNGVDTVINTGTGAATTIKDYAGRILTTPSHFFSFSVPPLGINNISQFYSVQYRFQGTVVEETSV